jgi:hypothetical protein
MVNNNDKDYKTIPFKKKKGKGKTYWLNISILNISISSQDLHYRIDGWNSCWREFKYSVLQVSVPPLKGVVL